jgi:glycosyltransferase involved in cell wall biosynthesis
MPTKNRAFCIDKILESISTQDYPKEKIKIVIIDESTDGTYEKLLQWKEQNKKDYLEIQIMQTESKGYISVLRNLCVANMEGDVIFFWDSDVIAPDNHSLSRVLKLLEPDFVGAAGLPYYNENPSLYERIMQAEVELGGMGFTAIKKTVFGKVGLFNEKLKVNEDTDIFSRIKAKGLKVKFDVSTPGLHIRRANVKSGFRDNLAEYKLHLRWSFSKVPFLYAEMIRAGSKSHLFRLFYYFALPIIIVLWFINLAFPIVPIVYASAFVAGYLLLNFAYHIWKAKQSRLWGVVAFFYYAPWGISISYGYLLNLLKSSAQKKKQA